MPTTTQRTGSYAWHVARQNVDVSVETYLCTFGAGCNKFVGASTELPAGQAKYNWCLFRTIDGVRQENCGNQFVISKPGPVSLAMGKYMDIRFEMHELMKHHRW